MDHLSHLTPQEQRPEAHNEPPSAAPDAQAGQAPELPAAPSMSEAHARLPLLQALPPPAPADAVRSSVPTLAVGAKRSAADAGLEADPDAGGKRVKLGHSSEQATGDMLAPPDPVAGRKRSALDAGLDEDAQPASKRLRQDEPGRLQNHGQAMMADDEPPAQGRVPEEAAGAGDALNVQGQVVQRPEEMSIALSEVWFEVVDNDLQAIQAWLKTPGVDVNAMLSGGETALHVAARWGHVRIVQALLATPGIHINARDSDGGTALHVAAQQGHVRIVQALLATPGIDIDALDSRGTTALNSAMLFEKLSVMEVFLKAAKSKIFVKAFPNLESALISTAERDGIAGVESLLVHPWITFAITRDRDFFGRLVRRIREPELIAMVMAMPGIHVDSKTAIELLPFAASERHIPLLKLLQARPDYDANAKDSSGRTVLMNAVESGNLPVVQALLSGPDINLAAQDRDGNTALKMAIEKDVPAIIDALLAAQGINVGSSEFLARHREFLAAAEAGDLVQVRFLLASIFWLDVNFKKRDQTALKLAIEKSRLEVVQELLAMPGIVVDRDTCAEIAQWAARDGHLPLLRRVMDRPEFDVNNRYGKPHLVTAAENGHLPIVQALLAAPGIDVNAGSHYWGALFSACENDHYQIAMLLAATPGIYVDVSRDSFQFKRFYGEPSEKCSPLKLVTVRGNLRLVRALLDAESIDVNDKDNYNFTPLMYAAHHGHLEIVRALLAMPKVYVHHSSDRVPSYIYGVPRDRDGPLSALSLAEWAGNRQIVEALLAMPVPFWSAHKDLHKSLLERSHRAPPKPEKKQIPEQTYRFLHRILHPGFDAGSPLPLFSPDQQQRPSWLEQKCMDVSLGTCPVTDVPFLLKSTMPLPAWCQAALANAIALGFAAGHYRSAPAAFWKSLQARQAWLAGLAFGARVSRQDAIELDAGISHELETMGLWNVFLTTLETLLKLKADPDGVHLDSLTLLGRAARGGDLPMIRYLASLGANIHLRSPNGDAPILSAARAGQWAACAELLSLGAMPSRVDRKGYPALFHIASAFANSDTASPALAKLIRYLRLKNVRFDIPVPNPDEETRTENPTVLISDILLSNPEPWILFGKDVFGINDAPLPATATVPAAPAPQAVTSKLQLHAMFHAANPEAAVAAWLDADPQRLQWQDPDNGQGLLHLAAAWQNTGLVRLLLDRGMDRLHADRAGQTAAQLLPADYMSSYTAAAASIAALLR